MGPTTSLSLSDSLPAFLLTLSLCFFALSPSPFLLLFPLSQPHLSPRRSERRQISAKNTPKAVKRVRKLKIAVINGQSIRRSDKWLKLNVFLSKHKPDIVFITETWLSEEISNSEIFPNSYSVYRRDRHAQTNGGGVIIAVSNSISNFSIQHDEPDCELVWCCIEPSKGEKIYLGCFYRQPDNCDASLWKLYDSAVSVLGNNHERKKLILAGDFNCPGVDWVSLQQDSVPEHKFQNS